MAQDRTRRSRGSSVLMTVCLVFGGIFALSWGGEPRPHMYAGGATLSPESAGAEGSRPGADSMQCSSCHQFEAGMSHPVHIRPSMAVPPSLPLSGGMITCGTCHQVDESHGRGTQGAGLRAGLNAATLCSECHRDGSLSGGGHHASAVNRAHLSREMPHAGKTAGRGIDEESGRCMSCHDGATAMEAGSHAVRSMNSELMSEHPIGVPMRATERTRSGDFKLASPFSLDRRIRLFNGNLGCGSCHSVYSHERADLVMNNRGSKLCLSCHKG